MAKIKISNEQPEQGQVHPPVNARQGNVLLPAQRDEEEIEALRVLQRFFNVNGFPMGNPARDFDQGYYINGILGEIINGQALSFSLYTKHNTPGYLVNKVRIVTEDDTIERIGNFAGRLLEIQRFYPNAKLIRGRRTNNRAYIDIPVMNLTDDRDEVLRILREIITPVFNL